MLKNFPYFRHPSTGQDACPLGKMHGTGSDFHDADARPLGKLHGAWGVEYVGNFHASQRVGNSKNYQSKFNLTPPPAMSCPTLQTGQLTSRCPVHLQCHHHPSLGPENGHRRRMSSIRSKTGSLSLKPNLQALGISGDESKYR